MKKENSIGKKKWWAPVWNGLVMDEEAAHFRKMGNALWLFLYFLLNANRRTGTLVRKVRTISTDMGIPRRKIFQWLHILRREDYITTRNSGRFLTVEINRWKPLREVSQSAREKCQIPHRRGVENRTSQSPYEPPNPAHLKENWEVHTGPKQITIKENILNIDIDNKIFMNANFNLDEKFNPRTREELLALDLAEALDDAKGLALYLAYAKRFPESYLRGILAVVKDYPVEKIRTSRGAFFNFLVQKHARKSPDNSSR